MHWDYFLLQGDLQLSNLSELYFISYIKINLYLLVANSLQSGTVIQFIYFFQIPLN